MGAPSWQDLEKAIIKVLTDYGYELHQDRGETYVLLDNEEVSVSEFAKHLCDELE